MKKMIEITDEHIKNGKLDQAALADFGADAVEFDGDKIIFKGIIYITSQLENRKNLHIDFYLCYLIKSNRL